MEKFYKFARENPVVTIITIVIIAILLEDIIKAIAHCS